MLKCLRSSTTRSLLYVIICQGVFQQYHLRLQCSLLEPCTRVWLSILDVPYFDKPLQDVRSHREVGISAEKMNVPLRSQQIATRTYQDLYGVYIEDVKVPVIVLTLPLHILGRVCQPYINSTDAIITCSFFCALTSSKKLPLEVLLNRTIAIHKTFVNCFSFYCRFPWCVASDDMAHMSPRAQFW